MAPYQLEEVWGSTNLMSKLGLNAPPHELTALLWQTGYLTIMQANRTAGRLRYLLAYPNQEVREAFLLHMWYDYAAQAKDSPPDSRLEYLTQALFNDDLTVFFEHFQSLMATIPYQLFIKQEAYYHTLIYLVLELSGLKPQAEVSVAGGRTDMVLETPGAVYVFEFKIGTGDAADALVQAALSQIKEMGYHSPFLGLGKKVVLVGAAFDSPTRTLAAWRQEGVV